MTKTNRRGVCVRLADVLIGIDEHNLIHQIQEAIALRLFTEWTQTTEDWEREQTWAKFKVLEDVCREIQREIDDLQLSMQDD